jgi:hypothetical protein
MPLLPNGNFISSALRPRKLSLILRPGQVTELRVLNCKVAGEYRTGTFSGYFTRESIGLLIDDLRRIESASACYFTPNSVKPELHGRAFSRARIIKDRDATTTDKDILQRDWLLIDADSIRPAGISATPEEKHAAELLINDVAWWLHRRKLTDQIVGDSGNGYHVMVRWQKPLPADDGGKTEKLLKHIAAEFNGWSEAQIDTTVGNAARIWKLPGTLTCKGDNCPEIGREWRMSRIICAGREAQDRITEGLEHGPAHD